jgi:RNA polymerase sigma factor (sigma-70 family)
LNELLLIRGCSNGNPKAQKALYEVYATRMFRICFRYIGNQFDAEDVLTIAFTKVFRSIARFEYRGTGSLDKWIKTIMINESLMFLRAARKLQIVSTDDMNVFDIPVIDNNNMEAEAIFALITRLPDGYRTIFNLFVIDGLSHDEIAAQLGISVGTSKSQLSRARALLQEQMIKLEYHGR